MIYKPEDFAKYEGIVGRIVWKDQFYVDLELPDKEVLSFMRMGLEKVSEEEAVVWETRAFVERI